MADYIIGETGPMDPNRLDLMTRPGDLLVYDWEGAPTHVGIVWEHEPLPEDATWKTRILSQWDRDGEYFHAASDVPDVLGKPHQFWTERVTVDA